MINRVANLHNAIEVGAIAQISQVLDDENAVYKTALIVILGEGFRDCVSIIVHYVDPQKDLLISEHFCERDQKAYNAYMFSIEVAIRIGGSGYRFQRQTVCQFLIAKGAVTEEDFKIINSKEFGLRVGILERDLIKSDLPFQDRIIYRTNLSKNGEYPSLLFDHTTTLEQICQTILDDFHLEHPMHHKLSFDDIQIVMNIMRNDGNYLPYNITRRFYLNARINAIIQHNPFKNCDLHSINGFRIFIRARELDKNFQYTLKFFTGDYEGGTHG